MTNRVVTPLFVILLAVQLSAQTIRPTGGAQNDLARGIELYQQGKLDDAAAIFREVVNRNKQDISAWFYLAKILEQQGKKADALEDYERAAKIADDQLTYSLDREAIFHDQNGSPTPADMNAGAESAARYIALSSNLSNKKTQEWVERAEYLRLFGDNNLANLEIYSGKDVTTKLKILSKPLPSYTSAARQNKVNGTVVLRALFAADGHIRAIRVVSGLPDGLTRVSVAYALQIKFEPATKDGRRVSQWLQVEYNFNTY